jgi:hypothetical protein
MQADMLEHRKRYAANTRGFLVRDRPVIALGTAGLNCEAWHIGASVAGFDR